VLAQYLQKECLSSENHSGLEGTQILYIKQQFKYQSSYRPKSFVPNQILSTVGLTLNTTNNPNHICHLWQPISLVYNIDKATTTAPTTTPTTSTPNTSLPATPKLAATVPFPVQFPAPPLPVAVPFAATAVTLTGTFATPSSGYAAQSAFGSSGQSAAIHILCNSGGAPMPGTAVAGAQRVLKSVLSVEAREEASEAEKPRDRAEEETVLMKKDISA
jgi:hypothetical protein